MTKTKAAAAEAAEPNAAEATFTREQLAASRHFQHRRDVIRAVLEEDRLYTLDQAQAAVDAFLGRKVR